MCVDNRNISSCISADSCSVEMIFVAIAETWTTLPCKAVTKQILTDGIKIIPEFITSKPKTDLYKWEM